MTQHPPHATPPPSTPLDQPKPRGHQPPPPNPVAAELRGILDDLHDAEPGDVPRHLVRERLERLAEHVERLSASPVEVDASTELTASFGPEPEQQCRADALTAAARLLGPALGAMSLSGADANRETIARLWIELAQYGEAWISAGSRP